MSTLPKHTISILVENEFGVLSRVAAMFSGRGYNIESLSVAETLDATVSRITMTVRGDASVLEQVTKQLYKMVAVMNVVDFRQGEYVDRELALVKVVFEPSTRAEVMNIVNIFRASVIDVGTSACIIEITGAQEKIDAMVRLLEPIGIKEIARTGSAALYRGERLLAPESPASAPADGAKENLG
ncbi:MAG TPA: acetolactate synthase small subunit [Candidatus Binatia bacterium]|jgi:acetolactate synthase-1/3 small subunit